MERLHNGYTLEIPAGAFPLSTDSVALADFVKLPRNAKVLDLGSGCGTLGLYLCAKDPNCCVTGIELDTVADQAARQNAEVNKITHRLTSICADINSIPSFITPGSFDCCVSNPPYFSAGPESKAVPAARREDFCTIRQLLSGAAWALKHGGDLFIVYRPERLAELIAAGAACGLETKRLRLLYHRRTGPVTLVLVHMRKGAKPGLIWEEVFLRNADETFSDYYRTLYHIKEE